MKKTISLSLAISMLLLSGCTNIIFTEAFDEQLGSPQQYPSGPPSGDMIRVTSPQNPLVVDIQNNRKLKFTAPDGLTTFISHQTNNSDNIKTIKWEGNLSFGTGPIWFIISAGDSTGDFDSFPRLRMLIWSQKAKLEDWISPSTGWKQLESGTHNSWQNYVSIRLRLETGRYNISMTPKNTQLGIPISWSGFLKPEFVNHINNRPRILMKVVFPSIATPSTYRMDNISMTEEKPIW